MPELVPALVPAPAAAAGSRNGSGTPVTAHALHAPMSSCGCTALRSEEGGGGSGGFAAKDADADAVRGWLLASV